MAAIQLDMFEVQLGAGLLLQFRHGADIIRVLADAGVHASGYPVNHVHRKLPAALRAFSGTAPQRIDLIVGTHYDADHLTGLVPIIEDLTLEIGEAWLPPVANDTEDHAAEDQPSDQNLLALQLAGPQRRQVLGRYLAAKAQVCALAAAEDPLRARPEPPGLRMFAWAHAEPAEEDEPQADLADIVDPPEQGGDEAEILEEAIDWFEDHLLAAQRAAGERGGSHADVAVSPPRAMGEFPGALFHWTNGVEPGHRSAGTARTNAYIRKAAAEDAINAVSLAKVVAALKARHIPIRCATIDDGEPRRFIWDRASRRFQPNPAAPAAGPELLLLAPSNALLKRHWDRLPVGTYFQLARFADLPIRSITPSNQLSYVLVISHESQRVLVTGDAGCVDFKPEKGRKYFPKLLAGLTPLHVVQVAHHGGNNAHFYRVLEAAGIVSQAPPVHFLLSHATEDRTRPSDVFARFMEHLATRGADRLLFTSRPSEPKVRDFRDRIHPVVGGAGDVGDVRLTYDNQGWAVLAHAVAVTV